LIGTEEIRKIPQFSGQTTGVTQSDLQFKNGYLVYSSSFGGNLVDEFTVRDFLDNSNNEKFATDFFEYLQLNYSKPEFNELYYNNLKLANILNDYYAKTVLENVAPTKTVANLQLTATTAVTYTSTNFINYDNRSIKKITAIIGYNTGDSYYISVPISSNYNILDNPNYDKYRINSFGGPQQYLYAEWFRYAQVKGAQILTPKINDVEENSFNDYTADLPIPINPPLLRIQFKNDKYVIPENSQSIRIPIDIVFDKQSTFSGQSFQVRIESIKGGPLYQVKLDDGSGNDNRIAHDFSIINGQSAVTTTLVLKNAALLSNPNLEITIKLFNLGVVALNNYTISNKPFIIQTIKPVRTQVENDISYDYVKESIKTRPQYLLQSFVDLNFNDSESEFYRNASSTSPSLIPGLIVASPPPPPPPPPAPTPHNPNINPADLTQNSLYNKMIRFGYTLEKRIGIGGTIITMNGDNPDVNIKFSRFFGFKAQIKPIEYRVLGYNSITFDVNNISETNRIISVLEDFWRPVIFD